MLHETLSNYLRKLESCVDTIDDAYIEHFEEEILTFQRVNIRIRVRFETGNLLEINEAVIVKADELLHLNYRYHLQDSENKMIFRFDNTPHFPDLDSFPNHKHIVDKIVSQKRPSISEVIKEAIILNNS